MKSIGPIHLLSRRYNNHMLFCRMEYAKCNFMDCIDVGMTYSIFLLSCDLKAW